MVEKVGFGYSLNIINGATTENEVSVVREMPLPVPSICLDRPERIKLCEGVLDECRLSESGCSSRFLFDLLYLLTSSKEKKGPGAFKDLRRSIISYSIL